MAQLLHYFLISALPHLERAGADRVIDYTQEDFTSENATYDIVFDTIGKSSFSGSLKVLKEQGLYLRAVHFTIVPVLRGLWTSLTSSKKVIGGTVFESKKEMLFLKELIEAGKMKSVIDREFSLEQTAEAHKYIEQRHQQGSVVMIVE